MAFDTDRPAGLTEEQAGKARFVDRKLEPMLAAATDGDVRECSYAVDGRNCEFVHVVFGNGFRRRVNVTADSKTGIASDVLRAL